MKASPLRPPVTPQSAEDGFEPLGALQWFTAISAFILASSLGCYLLALSWHQLA